jgi:glutamine cyclotransferase
MKKKILLSIVGFHISILTVLLLCCKPKDQVIVPSIDHITIDTLLHDTTLYTQGLTFYKGELYEGTGDPGYIGKTRLMKIDLKTGKPLQSISLSDKYFGEGITILRDTIYQLTWQEHKVFCLYPKRF